MVGGKGAAINGAPGEGKRCCYPETLGRGHGRLTGKVNDER